jgi:hypothetical protein
MTNGRRRSQSRATVPDPRLALERASAIHLFEDCASRISQRPATDQNLSRSLAAPKPVRDTNAEQEYSNKDEDILPTAIPFQVRRFAFVTLGQLDWHSTPRSFGGAQPLPLQPRIDLLGGRCLHHTRKFASLTGGRGVEFPRAARQTLTSVRLRTGGRIGRAWNRHHHRTHVSVRASTLTNSLKPYARTTRLCAILLLNS